MGKAKILNVMQWHHLQQNVLIELQIVKVQASHARASGERIGSAAWHEQAQQRDTQATSPSTSPLRVGSTSMADRDLQHTSDGGVWDRAASQPAVKHNQLLTACLQQPGGAGDSVQSFHLAAVTSESGADQTFTVLQHTCGIV